MLRLIAAASIAALLLAACSGESSQTAATEPAAAPSASAPAAPAAPPADTAGAEAFVRQVYAGYTDASGATGPDHYANTYSAELNRLIRAGGPTGEPPNLGLDVDPICECQDWQALTLTGVTVTPQGADRADARAAFTNMGAPTTVTLALVREAGGWRVDDVRSADGASLAAELRTAASRPAG